MSSSTISTVNKYLLSSSGPYVPPLPYVLKQSNMNFPDSFTGLTTTFTNLHTDDARITFSSGMSGNAWRDIANGYELLCSSYNNWQGSDEYYIHDIFDSTGATTSWYPNTNNSNWIYKVDGVEYRYTKTSYATGGNYIGGGTGYFWTTVYNTGSVNGEWFQVKFPFKALFKSMDIKARTGALDRCCKAVRILGSNNGSTWFFIANLTYTAFSTNVWQNKASTASDKYFYIRVVVMTTISNPNLNISSCRIIYDAYAQ
jgi:hypothetical protein